MFWLLYMYVRVYTCIHKCVLLFLLYEWALPLLRIIIHENTMRCYLLQFLFLFLLFLLYVFIFTNYVFISMIHIMSTFTKCDNIITLVNQPLTLCAIRYHTDQVKLCLLLLLLFLYAFLVYELLFNIVILCCLFV